MSTLLGTARLGSWSVAELRTSIISELGSDKAGETLQLFFYAVSELGWREINAAVRKWAKKSSTRKVIAFVGTDHGLTEPDALSLLQKEGIDVRMMVAYTGVFHPKVFWLAGKEASTVWIGSNNLTRDGLVNNVEFAAIVKTPSAAPESLAAWAANVELGSTPLTEELLDSYRSERKSFEAKRASAGAGTFTWTKKHEKPHGKGPKAKTGDLILEIMPQETRGGNQVQIPREAAADFFGLEEVGSHTTITLRRAGTRSTRSLVLTVFGNKTVRISLNELEYRDRPCVVQFQKTGRNSFQFEIVPESIFPSSYRQMLKQCGNQTRAGSRRWTIV